MSFEKAETTLSAEVATSGTFTLSYPANTNAGSFAAFGHKMWVDKFQRLMAAPDDFTVSFGASEITVTHKGSTSIPVGARVNVQLNKLGDDDQVADIDFTDDVIYRAAPTSLVTLTLGAPDAIDADGVSVSASITSAAGATIGGALAADGVATFDVPRNVIITSAGNDSAKTFTVTGTDEYGNTLKENITGANAGAASGKKAFKTVTAVAIDSDSAGAVTIGNGDVLGLPVFLPNGAHILKELEDGAAATAGTTVAGVSTAATATTGDVRGTYDPNSACDGAKVFELVVALPDSKYKGVAQYAG